MAIQAKNFRSRLSFFAYFLCLNPPLAVVKLRFRRIASKKHHQHSTGTLDVVRPLTILFNLLYYFGV